MQLKKSSNSILHYFLLAFVSASNICSFDETPYLPIKIFENLRKKLESSTEKSPGKHKIEEKELSHFFSAALNSEDAKFYSNQPNDVFFYQKYQYIFGVNVANAFRELSVATKSSSLFLSFPPIEKKISSMDREIRFKKRKEYFIDEFAKKYVEMMFVKKYEDCFTSAAFSKYFYFFKLINITFYSHAHYLLKKITESEKQQLIAKIQKFRLLCIDIESYKLFNTILACPQMVTINELLKNEYESLIKARNDLMQTYLNDSLFRSLDLFSGIKDLILEEFLYKFFPDKNAIDNEKLFFAFNNLFYFIAIFINDSSLLNLYCQKRIEEKLQKNISEYVKRAEYANAIDFWFNPLNISPSSITSLYHSLNPNLSENEMKEIQLKINNALRSWISFEYSIDVFEKTLLKNDESDEIINKITNLQEKIKHSKCEKEYMPLMVECRKLRAQLAAYSTNRILICSVKSLYYLRKPQFKSAIEKFQAAWNKILFQKSIPKSKYALTAARTILSH